MNQEYIPKVGDILGSINQYTLAKKIKITKVSKDSYVADVLIGNNTKEPLTVFKRAWHLYKLIK